MATGADERTQRGQASVELVAMVPFVLLVGAVVWQLALAGHTAWLTAHAAPCSRTAASSLADSDTVDRAPTPVGIAA